ncbi:MAG: asparagine synthase (glutamine-hydrolyzing) [Planctomycetota bacterium]|jgi:asparagine synthase (glutamine-hydrolysing)|nr:asparagine synthase (glutamine-hydrolyzing) [Planctomycetota bacterium]MDA1025526.1 asparagine synthase (glutamine-hydrolyzing) [Planctomycetota bacterium]
MCGIAAIFTKKPDSRTRSELERSIRVVRHRGPDGEGVVTGDLDGAFGENSASAAKWGLAHARLAIVGLGDQGHQPMADRGGRRWLSFNGEIYNHIELRKELETGGFKFETTTDTEVILAAWSAWGEACVERFNGMFAFVLVDLDRRTAHAVRDRLGIKPLYLRSTPHRMAVASEIKQFTADEGFQPQADLQMVHDFLFDGLLGHEPRRCMFEGVEPVEPGTIISFDLDDPIGTRSARTYWSLDHIHTDTTMTWEDAVDQTKSTFLRSLSLRMRADVPVGSCLSGGLDSSSIVCAAASALGIKMTTFSSCYEDRRFDEQEYIDVVNRSANANPIKVFPTEKNAIDLFDRIVWAQDEPFGSMSLLSQWSVMAAARTQGIPVLLDGQGGDETFGGYRKFTWLRLLELARAGRPIGAMAHAMRVLHRGDRNVLDLRRGLRYFPAFLRRREASVLIPRPRLEAMRRRAWSERMSGTRDLGEHRKADLLHWSLPALLRYEDRSSMAHSIEARVPLIDHELVEHAMRVPSQHLFARGQSKSVFREAMREFLPTSIRTRRTKMGFASAQQIWMQSEFGDMIRGRVRDSEALQELIDPTPLLTLEPRLAKSQLVQDTLFRAASLATWFDRFGVRLK